MNGVESNKESLSYRIEPRNYFHNYCCKILMNYWDWWWMALPSNNPLSSIKVERLGGIWRESITTNLHEGRWGAFLIEGIWKRTATSLPKLLSFFSGTELSTIKSGSSLLTFTEESSLDASPSNWFSEVGWLWTSLIILNFALRWEMTDRMTAWSEHGLELLWCFKLMLALSKDTIFFNHVCIKSRILIIRN